MKCAQYRDIPNNLKTHRLAKGLSQQEVARLLNLKNNTLISRWEKGEAFPNLINIVKLCELYQVSFHDLFGSLIKIINEGHHQ